MKRFSFLLLSIISIALFSCSDDAIQNPPVTEDEKSAIVDEALQSAVLDELLQDIDNYSLLGEGLKSGEIGDCPVITIEKPDQAPFWPRKTILDFGDGCEKNGKLKSGRMLIEKSGPWYIAGSTRKVTFENYVVDGMSIEGEKEITNISEEGGNITFEIEAELDLNWTKNDTISISVQREINKTQEWIVGFREKDVRGQVILNGQTEIKRTVNGTTKEIKRTFNDLKRVFGCRFPQLGVTEFEVVTFDGKELEFKLDYGTEGSAGEKCRDNCDCIATLTIGDNESEEIDLSEKWRKWQKEKKRQDKDN